jgi:hypothetical protein
MSTPTAGFRAIIALGALLFCLAPAGAFAASGAAFWQPNVDAPGSSLVTARGDVIHRTVHPVYAARAVEPLGTDLELLLWDEELTAGQRTPHYAILENGQLRGRVRSTSYTIGLGGERFDPLTDGAPVPPAALQARADNRLFLVQLVTTPLPALQEAIRAQGATIHRHLVHHTLIVEMSPAARAEVEALPFVRWVGRYHPADRLEPALHARLSDGAPQGFEPERYSILLFERGDELQAGLASSVRALGGTVDILTPRGRRIEATLDRDQLLALAHDPRVQYIDRWQGPLQTDMDVVREVGGADYVETVGGFTGSGVRAEVFDTELRTSHQEWLNSPLVHSSTSNGFSAHGSSVTSNVFAQGANSLARGVVPDAQPIFFLADEATQFGGTRSRYDIYAELRDPAGLYRGVFQTSSVGNNRTFFYTTISAETDDALFLNPVLSTQSQSNAGNQDSRPQAWAKNIVSIGGIIHFGTADRTDDTWSTGGSAASTGPANDGRIKPDLAFFYDGIFSATRTSDTSYTSGFGGTSSATPQTAGYFGLLFQMWHEGLWSGHGGGATVFDSRPQMMTAKALMIHHAHRYDWTQGGANGDIDRFRQGWGTADARNLYDTAAQTFILDEEVALLPLGSYSTTVTLSGTEPELKATMAYLDPMGVVGAGVHRINDLSLRVTSPTGTVYWGNNGLTTSNESTSGGVSNEIDTVENVFVSSPEAGTWTIEVLADEVVADNHPETKEIDADFALIVSPAGASEIFSDGFESGTTSSWSSVIP